MTSHPTVGVEEEFLLVDPRTGEPIARNEAVADHAATHGVKLQLELTSCQIETTTGVAGSSGELRAELARLRRIAAEAAEASGRGYWRLRFRRPCRISSRSPTPRATARSPTNSA